MTESTNALIAALANKLGTTVEHLWGVLLSQAPISGAVELGICVAMTAGAVLWTRHTKNKTAKKKDSPDDRYGYAEWTDEGAGLAWMAVVIAWIIVVTTVACSATSIVSAFVNPEYWALKQLMLLR